MVFIFSFMDDVMFSYRPNGAFTVAGSGHRPPCWVISTRPRLAANDLTGWRGGLRYYGEGAKSAVHECLVLALVKTW